MTQGAPTTGGGSSSGSSDVEGDAATTPATDDTTGAVHTSRRGRWFATALARGPPALRHLVIIVGFGAVVAAGPVGAVGAILADEAPATSTVAVTQTSQPRGALPTSSVASELTTSTGERPSHLRLLSGDTLGRIAHALGVGLDELVAANPQIANPNKVRAGQLIELPDTWRGTWHVAYGDTLSAVGVRLARTPEQIASQDPGRFAGHSLDEIDTGETFHVAPAQPDTEQPDTQQPDTQQPDTQQPGDQQPGDHGPPPVVAEPQTGYQWSFWAGVGGSFAGAVAAFFLGRAAFRRVRDAHTLTTGRGATIALTTTAPPLGRSWQKHPAWIVADAAAGHRRAVTTYQERTQVVPWLAARLGRLEPSWSRDRIATEIAAALGGALSAGEVTRLLAEGVAANTPPAPLWPGIDHDATAAEVLTRVTTWAERRRVEVERAGERRTDAVRAAQRAGIGGRSLGAALGLSRAATERARRALPTTVERQHEALARLYEAWDRRVRDDFLAAQVIELDQRLDQLADRIDAGAPAVEVEGAREEVIALARQMRDAVHGFLTPGGFQSRHGRHEVADTLGGATGVAMTPVRGRVWAGQLEAPASAPGTPAAARATMDLFVRVTRELLDPTLGTAARDELAVRFPALTGPEVRWFTLRDTEPARSSHTWDGPVLEVRVNLGQGVGAAVHEVTEALLVRAGYTPEAAHRIATFTERAVPGQVLDATRWLTRRVVTRSPS